MCSEHREACPSSPAAETGQSGFGEDICSNVKDTYTCGIFPGKAEVCTASFWRQPWFCRDKSEIYFHRSVVCFPLIQVRILLFFSLFSVTILCFQSLLSLPQIYWGSMREKWNEAIYFACHCLAVNWVLVVLLVILWHITLPGCVLLPSQCVWLNF